MNKYSIVICYIVFVCSTIVRTELSIEEGGYSNILVSFAQNIPKSHRSKTLLDNLKAYLEDASTVLQRAIALRITSVTFLIPKDWDTSEWNITVGSAVSGQNTSNADILVDGASDSVFGKFPFAEQYGSCHTPGRQIVIPEAFLTEKFSFPKGTSLAREWLKYRYGVFDENGYSGDLLYPLFHARVNPNNITVTDCSNEIITYNVINTKGDICSSDNNVAKCLVIPNKESLEDVTSSLMYYHENIPNMQHVCGKESGHEHSTSSQNKHNALCRGQSIWDVLKQSKDFRNLKEVKPEHENKTEFNYVQVQNPVVVVALENTERLKDLGQPALNAIKKFVYDLPKGSKYSFFPYSDAINKEYSLRELEIWPDDWEKDSSRLSFAKQTKGCTNCALSKALDIIASDKTSEAEGTIIIITADSIEVDEKIHEQLETSKICLMFFVFSDSAVSKDYNEYLSASECGTLVEFSKTESNIAVFRNMFSTMESILPERIDDKIIETVQTADLRDDSETTFFVDETIEKVMFWIIPGKEADAIEVKYDGGSLETLTEELTSDVLALSYVPRTYGKLMLRNTYGGKSLVQIRTESKPGEYLTGEVLIHDTTEENSLNQMPVILYARLRFGSYPVQNAEVRAIVSRPDDSDIKFTMFDDGRGNPDITENDGVYSRFFTNFTKKGEYTVTVTIRNNGKDTVAGKDNSIEVVELGSHLPRQRHHSETQLLTRFVTFLQNVFQIKGYQPCCGSYVETGTLKLNDFTRKFKSSFNAVSGRPANGYKPSRIVDLRIEEIIDDKVVLTWTAPGGEADEGRALKYNVKLFCEDKENVTDCDYRKMLKILDKPLPMVYGRQQKVTIQILDNSQTLFIGIVTTNVKNLKSDLSNTVKLMKFYISVETTSNPDSYRRNLASIIIGSVVIIIIILVCIIIAIYLYKYKKRKSGETNDMDTNENNQEK